MVGTICTVTSRKSNPYCTGGWRHQSKDVSPQHVPVFAIFSSPVGREGISCATEWRKKPPYCQRHNQVSEIELVILYIYTNVCPLWTGAMSVCYYTQVSLYAWLVMIRAWLLDSITGRPVNVLSRVFDAVYAAIICTQYTSSEFCKLRRKIRVLREKHDVSGAFMLRHCYLLLHPKNWRK